eukprot:m51a1_g13427 hypothetical protein (73) ;mRNA; r:1959-2177
MILAKSEVSVLERSALTQAPTVTLASRLLTMAVPLTSTKTPLELTAALPETLRPTEPATTTSSTVLLGLRYG